MLVMHEGMGTQSRDPWPRFWGQGMLPTGGDGEGRQEGQEGVGVEVGMFQARRTPGAKGQSSKMQSMFWDFLDLQEVQ